MQEKESPVPSWASGIWGLLGLLVTLFIVMKLLNYIAWSWVWVLSPLWILALIMCSLVVFAAVLGTVSGALLRRRQAKQSKPWSNHKERK